MEPAPTWDLSAVHPGSPADPAFAQELGDFEAAVAAATGRADALGEPLEDAGWPDLVQDLTRLGDLGQQLLSFAHCAQAADARHPGIARAVGRGMGAASLLGRAWTRPRQVLARAPEAQFRALVDHPRLGDYRAAFERERRGAAFLLPGDEEALAAELMDSALHQWGRLYQEVTGQLEVTLEGEQLSLPQAINRLDHPDRDRRRRAFEGILATLGQAAHPAAQALGTMTATRTVLNRRRGLDELAEPLHDANIAPATLEAIVTACEEARPLVWRYLAAKARLLGLDELDWYDLNAPANQATRTWSWDEGAQVVAEALGSFAPALGALARRALDERWVEAEDRPGKQTGAFCAGFPLSRQSRVFMTWSGTPTNLLTLAHELGHAFHNHVLWDVPSPRRQVPTTLAETASTFAEAVVRGRLLDLLPDDALRLALVEKDLGAAATMLVNIPVRFAFERDLYELRGRGPLDPDELSRRMSDLQARWYGPVLGRPHPLFWVEKPHFYMSFVPFYNFPYTFGYLFSALVYARTRHEGAAGFARYVDLLRDTGSCTAEDLAERHLGLDLTRPATWRPVLDEIGSLVDTYERLAAQMPS